MAPAVGGGDVETGEVGVPAFLPTVFYLCFGKKRADGFGFASLVMEVRWWVRSHRRLSCHDFFTSLVSQKPKRNRKTSTDIRTNSVVPNVIVCHRSDLFMTRLPIKAITPANTIKPIKKNVNGVTIRHLLSSKPTPSRITTLTRPSLK